MKTVAAAAVVCRPSSFLCRSVAVAPSLPTPAILAFEPPPKSKAASIQVRRPGLLGSMGPCVSSLLNSHITMQHRTIGRLLAERQAAFSTISTFYLTTPKVSTVEYIRVYGKKRENPAGENQQQRASSGRERES